MYNISSRVDFFKKLNIQYKHVVFPSKPLLKQNYIADEYSNITSLFLHFYKKKLGTYSRDVIYPLEELKALEKKHSTFHKYNTHNSDLGYLEIANNLLNFFGLEAIPERFLNYTKNYVGGDLGVMLNSNDTNEEEFIAVSPMSSYSVGNRQFLPGNTNDVYIIHNKDALSSKRIIIFGDSFFKGLLKFLKIYFTDILYIRSDFVHKDIVNNFQPDIVISGNAERYLM